jgi:hypothetical protein
MTFDPDLSESQETGENLAELDYPASVRPNGHDRDPLWLQQIAAANAKLAEKRARRTAADAKSSEPQAGTTEEPSTASTKPKTREEKARAELDRWLERFKPLTAAEVAERPPTKWLVKDYIPADGISRLCGAPSSAKSFIALDWALSIAEGVPWLGHEVDQGQVIYICAESTGYVIPRLDAWRQEHKMSKTTEHFRIIDYPVPMLDERIIGYFILALQQEQFQPKLIVIDTLARCFGNGDENSTQDMNAFVNACERLRSVFARAGVLVLHHTGKDLSKGGRGSTALFGAVDIEFTATKKERSNTVTLKNTKAGKNSLMLDQLHLELVDLDPTDPGHGQATLKLANAAAIKEAQAEQAKDEAEETAFKALEAFGSKGASAAEWAAAVGTSVSTVKRRGDTLIEQGRVMRRGENKNTRWYAAEAPDVEDLMDEDLSALVSDARHRETVG